MGASSIWPIQREAALAVGTVRRFLAANIVPGQDDGVIEADVLAEDFAEWAEKFAPEATELFDRPQEPGARLIEYLTSGAKLGHRVSYQVRDDGSIRFFGWGWRPNGFCAQRRAMEAKMAEIDSEQAEDELVGEDGAPLPEELIKQFLFEECLAGEQLQGEVRYMYKMYERWCSRNRTEPLEVMAFNACIGSRYPRRRTPSGSCFIGVAVNRPGLEELGKPAEIFGAAG